jgi:hypothetical protein
VIVGRKRIEVLPSVRYHRFFSLDIKQPGREANHSFPSRAKRENEAIFPLILPSTCRLTNVFPL